LIKKSTDAIITVSEFVANQFAEGISDHSKIYPILNGVDINQFQDTTNDFEFII